MGGCRTKFVVVLIIFFAGFAMGIYCAVPVSEDNTELGYGKKISFPDSALKSDEFAKSFNTKMHKCLGIAKGVGLRAGKFIRQKINEGQCDS